jgi:hypothetical protein
MSRKHFTLFPVLFLTFAFCPNVFAKHPSIQNERLVINALRQIYNAQVQYQETLGAGDFGNLTFLKNANLIDDALASGQKYGYYFTLTVTYQTATLPPRFVLTAVPRTYRRTGRRSFYIDHRCTLRGADKNGEQATTNDPAIETCTPAIIGQMEARAIESLRTIHSAQAIYRTTAGNGNFGTLYDLYYAGLINPYLAGGHYYRYVFDCTVTIANPATPALFHARATPSSYGEMGVRSFYIDQTGVLRGADKNGGAASVNDPPIENPTAESAKD